MLPRIIESLYGMSDRYLEQASITASRTNSRNASVLWESERYIDYVYTFLERKRSVDGERHPELETWIRNFESDKRDAAWHFGTRFTRQFGNRSENSNQPIFVVGGTSTAWCMLLSESGLEKQPPPSRPDRPMLRCVTGVK